MAQIPTNLVAKWVVKSTNSSCPELTWNAPETSTFTVQRQYAGQAAWTTVTGSVTQPEPADSTLWQLTDTAISGTVARFYAYRVKIANISGSTPTETTIFGNPGVAWDDDIMDSDADGISDNTEKGLAPEAVNPHDYLDWADGTGDADGDGVPNAWEFWLDPTGMRNPNLTPLPHCVVSAMAETAEELAEYPDVPRFSSISAAIAALPSAPSAHKFRIIRVRPGIYNENVSITGSYHVAILPARGEDVGDLSYNGTLYPGYDPRKHWEIRGTHATSPVVTVSGSSLVLDSFVLNRLPGSAGPVVRVSLTGAIEARYYLNRFVNCLIAGNNTGGSAAIEQYRLRTVFSHCTVFMNGANDSASASAYGTAPQTTSGLPGTTWTQFHNCILWNPVNVGVREVEQFGNVSFLNTIMNYRANEPQLGVPQGPDPIESKVTVPMFTNPMLTPKGYLVGSTPATPDPTNEGEYLEGGAQGAMGLGAPNLHVMRDMHGELRRPAPPDPGAHQWDDDDLDGIPNFADRMMLEDLTEGALVERLASARSNAGEDSDFDGIGEVGEYRFSTDMQNADTYFLSVHQAVRMFLPVDASIYTKVESDALFYTKDQVNLDFLSKAQAHQLYRPRSEVVRVLPGGDIGMGEFTQGIAP